MSLILMGQPWRTVEQQRSLDRHDRLWKATTRAGCSIAGSDVRSGKRLSLPLSSRSRSLPQLQGLDASAITAAIWHERSIPSSSKHGSSKRKVKVSSMKGDHLCTVFVDVRATVGDVKVAIEMATGRPKLEQFLLYREQVLKDDEATLTSMRLWYDRICHLTLVHCVACQEQQEALSLFLQSCGVSIHTPSFPSDTCDYSKAWALPVAHRILIINVDQSHATRSGVALTRQGVFLMGLGIDIDPETLMINDISDHGLIATWNAMHTDELVRSGDRILEVNGIVDVEQLVRQELVKKGMLNIALSQASPEGRLPPVCEWCADPGVPPGCDEIFLHVARKSGDSLPEIQCRTRQVNEHSISFHLCWVGGEWVERS